MSVTTIVFVGTYTSDMDGQGPGIQVFERAGARLTPLAAHATPSPSYVIADHDRPIIYAVNERPDGMVSSYSYAGGDLVDLGSQPTGGATPCHLRMYVDPDTGNRHLLAANYDSGSVSVHPVDPTGRIAERTALASLTGGGPHPERQRTPHAHQVVHGPSTGRVGVVDLGSDVVHGFALDPVRGTLSEVDPLLRTAAGAGPRHAVHHPNGRWYVVCEVDGTIAMFEPSPDDGTLRQVAAVPASPSTPEGPNQPAGIVLSATGDALYVSNRGPDTITTFALDGGGEPRPIAETPTGGAWPRHFAIVADLMLVANERSHTVVSFRLDSLIPMPTGDVAQVGSPTCVLPVD